MNEYKIQSDKIKERINNSLNAIKSTMTSLLDTEKTDLEKDVKIYTMSEQDKEILLESEQQVLQGVKDLEDLIKVTEFQSEEGQIQLKQDIETIVLIKQVLDKIDLKNNIKSTKYTMEINV